MRKRMLAGLLATAGLVVLLSGPAGAQDAKQDPKAKEVKPKHLYGHNLRVRPGGETDWPKALKIGVEVFEESASKAVVTISDVGAITVTAPTTPGADRKSEWKTAHDLRCRKAGEIDRTQKTKQWGVEMFHDRSLNKLLYVCESGSVAMAPVPAGLVTDKGPALHHAMDLRVRLPEQLEFKDAKRFGVEAFKDENTGGLIYITETGAIAAAAAPATPPDTKNQPGPKALYGLDLRVRGADEPEFTEKTKRIGVEVFEDPTGKALMYITEAGYIAVVPQAKLVEGARGVTWKSAMGLRARKGGQEKFEEAKKYGIEVFLDNRTENLIFISETGSIAVLPKQ
jgi:hypothetical protein